MVLHGFSYPPADWAGVDNPWDGVHPDVAELRRIVCEVFRISDSDRGPAISVGDHERAIYARVYSFSLPGDRSVIARLVAPIKPLFKTEGEVAAIDFVRSRTFLPVPKVFAYCSEANPVGVEWVLMEYMPGVELGQAWGGFDYHKRGRSEDTAAAPSIIVLGDPQMTFLRSLHHPRYSVHRDGNHYLRLLFNPYELIVANRFAIVTGFMRSVLSRIVIYSGAISPSLLLPKPPPVFSTLDFVRLLALNGFPSTCSSHDKPTREKIIELFQGLQSLYPHHRLFGSSADPFIFRFCHGDLPDGNILVDPATGEITGIIDWECASFRPWWTGVAGVGWLKEDRQRFLFETQRPKNFVKDDTNPLNGGTDSQLPAFFRTELHRRDPDLFSCFLGGVEMRALLHAATDLPRPIGDTHIFLSLYEETGCWNDHRRGPFPFDMSAWIRTLVDLGEKEMERVANARKNATVSAQA